MKTWNRLVTLGMFAATTGLFLARDGMAESALGREPHESSLAAFGRARWIAPPEGWDTGKGWPIFRKEFLLDARPRQTTLRILGTDDLLSRV